MKLSLLIIACDEEHRLAACVASARAVVDEVVIVVQESSDGTLALARTLADRVVEHPRHGWCEPSRMDGVTACTGDWILNLDADEQLTPYGRAHLREWCSEPGAAFYRLRRLTTINGHATEDRPHGRLFRLERVIASAAIHTEFQPTAGDQSMTIDAEPVIDHHKTSQEQRADDGRYAGLAARMSWDQIPGWFDFAGLYDQAVHSAPAEGASLVEVGCWLGRSTAYLADAIRRSGKAIRLTAVDTWTGCDSDPTGAEARTMLAAGEPLYSRFLANIVRCGLAPYITPLRIRSPVAAESFAPASLDLVYIDGEHTYDAVWADIAAWRSRVKPGGILAGHDYDMPAVRSAVHDAFGPDVPTVGRASWCVRI